MQIDELDELLMRSDPARDVTRTEHQLLAELAEHSAPGQKRRYARPVAVGAIVAILLGGGGLATAAANDLWSPWAQNDPLAEVSYVLPSGKTCEYRLGDLHQESDGVADVIRDALAGAEFDDSEVVATAKAMGLTKDPLADDNTYTTALLWAVDVRMRQALAAHDFGDKPFDSLSGEAICS